MRNSLHKFIQIINKNIEVQEFDTSFQFDEDSSVNTVSALLLR